jgi:hypothetical protein
VKRRLKGGLDDDPILPTMRELIGFMSPAGCALIGYWLGVRWSGFMAGFLFAMAGVGLGTFVTRAWARDFYL